MRLDADAFGAFYRAVHGHDPFPWQQDITERILRDGWPDLVDVPTGLGKTSMLDVAVFVLAVTANQPGSERTGRRRIFFLVDRRLVVDEAHDHASMIAQALADGEREPAVRAVADALRRVQSTPSALQLEGVEREQQVAGLLQVTRMRGGTTWEASWMRRPDQVGIVTGTVDQIGSRFLFRGYGLSDNRRPIDAALTGTDALWLVDEAHLAEPLMQTVQAALQLDQEAHERVDLGVPPLQLVSLTATSRQRPAATYSLDVASHREHTESWRRLSAQKQLIPFEATKLTVVQQMASTAEDLARGGHRRILVVCNTVDRARGVHAELCRRGSKAADAPAQVLLLIGRSRPLDREPLVEEVKRRLGVATPRPADREAPEPLTILVATQTVEVGVNLDADALVTESASWDALVQRLGRVNRLGAMTVSASAVVVHDGEVDGPVYGKTRDACWEFLRSLVPPAESVADLNARAGVAISPLQCRDLAGRVPAEALRPPHPVPVLFPATMDSWVQTSPTPLVDPPVAEYLHGFDGPSTDVSVTWRSGILDRSGAVDELRPEAAVLLAVLPPRAEEQVQLPFIAVRQWLTGGRDVHIGDLETPWYWDDPDPGGSRHRSVLAMRRSQDPGDKKRPEESWTSIGPDQIGPGDNLVVPVEYGGLDRFGWDPSATGLAVDLGEAAPWKAAIEHGRGPRVLRLNPETLERLGLSTAAGKDADEVRATWSAMLGVLNRQGDEVFDDWRPSLIALLKRTRSLTEGAQTWLDKLGAVDGWALLHEWLRGVPARGLTSTSVGLTDNEMPFEWRLRSETAPAALSDDESVGGTSGSGQEDKPVTLARHLKNVGARAEAICRALGMPDDELALVVDAARWHDLGKAERRFQVMLHRGDRFKAELADEPLAKSGLSPADRDAWRAAHKASDLPAGARHEAWSAALVEAHLASRTDPSSCDLPIHLVASHHGRARPLLPPVNGAPGTTSRVPSEVTVTIDDSRVSVPVDETLSLAHPARFQRLNRRYGRWGLALLETIVRSADMTVSEEGS